jgi:hypothetical protein
MSKVFTTKDRRVMEAKTRASDTRDAKVKEKAAAESDFVEPVPPLLVVLRREVARLPAGIVIQFESEALALHLIRCGLGVAVPKADFTLNPSVVISGELADFYEFAGASCS